LIKLLNMMIIKCLLVTSLK